VPPGAYRAATMIDAAPLSIMTLRRPEVLANPYPFYDRLRREAPALRDPLGVRLLSRYTDVTSALGNPRLSANRLDQSLSFRPDRDDPAVRGLFASIKRQMLFLDPPQHTRIRALAAKAFSPARIERMRETIQAIVDRLLDAAAPRGQVDLIADLGVPLPMVLIAEMLGVPASDQSRLKRWSEDYAVFLGGTIAITTEQMLDLVRSMSEFMGYFRELAAKRRVQPCDDLLTALVQAEEAGDTLDRDDLSATCVLLITAGHETTTNLIGNGALALLRDAGALARLRADPALLPSAVEELLRYDSPAQLSARRATEDLEIAGDRIAAGELVYLALGAANRDPQRFDDPDRLDLARPNNRHVAFGQGPHYCVGAALARMEALAALRTLLARFPAMRLAGEAPRFRANPALRGLESLIVELA
jgi:cytochrome P450